MASATLRLHRRTGGVVGRSASWDIEVDGMVAGTIAVNETVELPLEPGQHTLRMRSGRRVSPVRSFDAADGEVVDYHGRGAMFWPQWVAALFKPTLWISLRRD